jgi:hypothetical protein
MIPVETLPGIWGWGMIAVEVVMIAVEVVISSTIYLIPYKNLCKYSSTPPPSTTVLKKNSNTQK